MLPPLHRWDPATVEEAGALLRRAGFAWWIAGGVAIELAVGASLRPHGDLDVAVLRRDAATVREAVAAWDVYIVDPPGSLRPWPRGAALPEQARTSWLRRPDGDAWRLQLLFEDADGIDWVYRRHAGVRRPLPALGATTARGVAYLVPEVQLLYKSKQPRPRDDLDLAAALPHLSTVGRTWLCDAVRLAHPDSPWRDRLHD